MHSRASRPYTHAKLRHRHGRLSTTERHTRRARLGYTAAANERPRLTQPHSLVGGNPLRCHLVPAPKTADDPRASSYPRRMRDTDADDAPIDSRSRSNTNELILPGTLGRKILALLQADGLLRTYCTSTFFEIHYVRWPFMNTCDHFFLLHTIIALSALYKFVENIFVYSNNIIEL